MGTSSCTSCDHVMSLCTSCDHVLHLVSPTHAFMTTRLQLEILRHSTIVKIEFDVNGCWHPLLDGIVMYFYCNDQCIGVKVTRKE